MLVGGLGVGVWLRKWELYGFLKDLMNRVAEKERRNNKVWYGWKNLCFLCSVLFCFSLTTLSLSLSAALPRGSYHIYIARERGSVCVMYVSEGVGSAWVLFSVCVRAWESVQVFLLSVKKMKGKEQKVVLWERGFFVCERKIIWERFSPSIYQ